MADFAIFQSLLVNFCVLLVIGFPFSGGQTTTPNNVICYYHAWNSPDIISDIDASICTHLVFYYIKEGNFARKEPFFDSVKQVYQLLDLRLSNPSLKCLLAVHGLDYGNPDITTATYERRQTFYDNAIKFLRTWDFDGIDIIWTRYVKQEIATITEEFRVALTAEATSSGREPLILMLRLPGWTGAIQESVDFQPLGEAVDILEVALSDDIYRDPLTSAGLANPLYGNGGYRGNVSAMITNYLDTGVAPEKLHMGVELYSPLFTLIDPQLTGVGAPIRDYDDPEPFSYPEVCKRLQEEGYTAEFDPEGLVNFAYKGYQWMTYEDPVSLARKMNYVHEHNLGGVAVKYLDADDYTGESCNQGKYPLISTLHRFTSSRAATTTPQAVSPPCPDDWIEYENSCYVLVNQPGTWFDAESLCMARNAFLATAVTEDENTMLKRMAQTAGVEVWIGGYDIFSVGDWRWVKGYQPITFTDWGKDQPNNREGTQHCLGYDASLNFTWNDFVCDDKQAFICEIGNS